MSRVEVAEASRQVLIDAAVESLAVLGLGAVSVRDVASRAGVSPGLVRHHFGSFPALLNAAYAHTLDRVDAVLESALAKAGDDPARRMHAFLDASFSSEIVDRDLLSAWLGFWGLVRNDPDAARLHAASHGAYCARLEALIRSLADVRGRQVDTRSCAVAMAAMLDGLWLELCLDPDALRRAEAAAVATRWVEGMLASRPCS